MQNYSTEVLRYFRQPVTEMGATIYGEAGSERQGALICFGADLNDDFLVKVGFRAFACPHIIAACNWVVEELQNAPVEALLEVIPAHLQAKFDIPVEKAGKLLILQDATRACYMDFQARFKSV